MRGVPALVALVLVLLGCDAEQVEGASPSAPTLRAFARAADVLRAPLAIGAVHVTMDARLVLADESDRPAWSLRTTGASGEPTLQDDDVITRSDGERVEEIELEADGSLEQRWRFDAPPEGAITVRVEVDHVARVDADERGLVLHSSRLVGARLRYSHGTWIDADGVEHAVLARWDGDAITLEVPDEIVRSSRFPAVLDPRLEPIFGIEAPVEETWYGYGVRWFRAAGNDHGYLLAMTQSTSSIGAHPRVVFVPAAGDFVDPWGTALDTSRWISELAVVDVVDEGADFLVAWPTPNSAEEPAGVRAQRFDGVGHALGSPFWIHRGDAFIYDVALLSAPGSTVARWMRAPGMSRPQQLCTVRVPHGGAPGSAQCLDLVGPMHDSYPPPEWMAASANGWIAVWFDVPSSELRALRFDEVSATYDSLTLSRSLTSESPLIWAVSPDAYRVMWGTTYVDVSTTGPPTTTAPRAAGRPASCSGPGYCGALRQLRSSPSHLFTFLGELGRFELDGSWTTVAPSVPTSPPTVESGGGFAYVSSDGVQRFDASLLPIDSAPELPMREMNIQWQPIVGAVRDRYAVAWIDARGLSRSVRSTRIARLDAAGTLLDITVFDDDAMFIPALVLPVADRFVVLGRARSETSSASPLRALSVAAVGDVSASGPHHVIDDARGEVMAQSEGATALIGWTGYDGAAHLVRMDADGRPLASHVDGTQGVQGLCRDSDDTLALVGTSVGGWWVARVAPAGEPSLTRLWRLAPGPPERGMVISLRNQCAVLWGSGSSWSGATLDSDGLLVHPHPIVTPSGDPVELVSAVSFDGWSQLIFRASRTHLWMVDSSLRPQLFVPYAPDRHLTDELASRLAGASARPGEHLVVWDMDSSARSVGDFPVRLQARLIGPDRALGEPCLGEFECASRHCVDGVCCNRACDGDCEACSASEGASADGACTVLGASTICRAAAGACDLAEACDGSSPTCPPDAPAPDGTACDDDVACNGAEVCMGGACSAATPLECAPPSSCMTGSCIEPDGCVWTPIAGCCTSARECDDGDAETIDECVDAMCRWTRVDAGTEPQGDAGIDAGRLVDAGTRDVGVDASMDPPTGGGCSCGAVASAGSGRATISAIVLALLALLRRRRRIAS